MNNFQIDEAISKMGSSAMSRYDGCHFIDEIPLYISRGHFYFCNTLTREMAKQNSSGHWTLVLCGMSITDSRPHAPIVFFDPLGSIPNNLSFVCKLLAQSTSIYYSNFPYQSVFSEKCGEHCLYVVANYVKGFLIVTILTEKYNTNASKLGKDIIVHNYFSHANR